MTTEIEMAPQTRLALTIVVMAATLVQVLDSTIANVALPHMQASLGAAPDTISWVLTSYIVAAAVATPVTGWLETRIGRRNLMAIAIAGFTIASVLCGLATSLQMMVASRLCQGVFGAFISPLAQAIMLDIYPEEERPKAMSIWGMGIMIGPIVGPVLGGILTDAYNWRWVFFINVPVGIFALIGILALLPRTRIKPVPFDTIGFALIALGLAAIQLVLDRGTQRDWFDSTEILIELSVGIAMFWMFAVHTLTSRNPIIPIDLFKDRNFLIANAFLMIVMGVLMSGAALLPPMLQGLLGYSTTQAGFLIMPRGVSMLFAMFFVGRMATRIDARIFVGAGMLLIVVSQWIMTSFSLEMGSRLVIIAGLIQGLGLGFVIMPLNLLAFSTIPAHLHTNGAAVWNLSRNIGGSIAISMFTALLAHNLQVSHSDLAGQFTVNRFPYFEAGLTERLGVESTEMIRMVDVEVNRQALMISYIDDFWLMAVIALSMLPLTLLLRPPKKSEPVEMMMME
jgi:DHA2 family multidrug resistance protein